MDTPVCNDIMVDLETTGTDPTKSAIIQIAAVRFDYATGHVDGDTFNMCLAIPGFREWNLGTREWWHNTNEDLLQKLLRQGQDPKLVMGLFQQWVIGRSPRPRMWAKPISFEFPFIQNYFRDFDVSNPFHFRDSIDLNSFTRGAMGDSSHRGFDKELPFDGDEHDAIWDVFHQIKSALHIKEALRATPA